MRRNFGCESYLNILLRAKRAFIGRTVGKCYKYLGLFHKDSSSRLYFGVGSRFINSKAIKLSDNVHFGVMARLECHGDFNSNGHPKIVIGQGTSFGDYCHIGAMNGITIGENVLGGSGITIIDHNHGNPKVDLSETQIGDPKQRSLVSKGPIIIGNNVWIADGVIVLAGSEIGNDSIIAAHAIVTGNVPPKTVYYGKKKD